MISINIIVVGKVREKYLNDGISEYTKRLGRYCKINIIEIPDEKIPDNPSPNQEQEVRQKEGIKILNHIRQDAYVIALCIEGMMLDSQQLAEKIQKITVYGKSMIDIVIGGSVGLTDPIKHKADLCLSFSKFTFPHQLMRLILFEQIYRTFKIIHGETYHK